MLNGSSRTWMLGMIVLLLAAGCRLSQESASPAETSGTAAAQAVQAFVEDFARQVLAAFAF